MLWHKTVLHKKLFLQQSKTNLFTITLNTSIKLLNLIAQNHKENNMVLETQDTNSKANTGSIMQSDI